MSNFFCNFHSFHNIFLCTDRKIHLHQVRGNAFLTYSEAIKNTWKCFVAIVAPEKQHLHTQDTEPNKHKSHSTKVQHGKPMSLLGYLSTAVWRRQSQLYHNILLFMKLVTTYKCCNPAAVYMIFRSSHKSESIRQSLRIVRESPHPSKCLTFL